MTFQPVFMNSTASNYLNILLLVEDESPLSVLVPEFSFFSELSNTRPLLVRCIQQTKNEKKLYRQLTQKFTVWNRQLQEDFWNTYQVDHSRKKLCKSLGNIIKEEKIESIIKKIKGESKEALLLIKELGFFSLSIKRIIQYKPMQPKAKSHLSRSLSLTNINNLKQETPLPIDTLLSMSDKKDKTIEDSLIDKILLLCPVNNSWIDIFERSLIETQDKIALIKKLGREANPHQIVKIIHAIEKGKFELDLITFLVGSMPFDNFRKFINFCSKKILSKLNNTFAESSKNTIIWLNNRFKHQQLLWRELANNTQKELDDFSTQLYLKDSYTTEELITFQIKAKTITELIQMTDKLHLLLKDIEISCSIKHVITEGCKKAYQKLLSRVTEVEYHSERVEGNLFGIVHRNIFEDKKIADEEKPTAMFGHWIIILPSDYKKVGLLGDLQDEWIEQLPNDYKILQDLGEKVLDLVGIKSVMDLKKFHILNRELLKSYLQKPEIMEKIKENIEEIVKSYT